MDQTASPESPHTPVQIMLITGMSGAGKTTALKTLEDMSWEMIDNFPIRLLGRLLATPLGAGQEAGSGRIAIGFDTRTRGFNPNSIIESIKKLTESGDYIVTTLFLDCTDHELERRYNETRRPHPMALDRPAASGIQEERELLAPLRRWADQVIDTSMLNSNALSNHMRERFPNEVISGSVITISSFGFARGMPPVADLVFDMRFLNNPHWIEGLREQTGQDALVGDYITQDPHFAEAYGRILDLLLMLLPRYIAQGKAYVHIAFGCTGGRHRSVYTAERIAGGLREAGFSPSVIHRNLTSRPIDALEKNTG
ncbi:MAG: RNase adapter RapZ [Pseudomonadota bacterium]